MEIKFKTYLKQDFYGHPRGLGVLFFVEFWERFSYYGMRALLIFYMYFAVTDNGLGIDKTTAMSIMSVYGSLIYMTSIPAEWNYDRITGTRGATLLGAVFIIIGHICFKLTICINRLIHINVLSSYWFRFNEAKHFKYRWPFIS
ncbi:hypothetical protein ACVXZZ_10430 [Staphylococcus aureus]